jgi:hypothetical protein
MKKILFIICFVFFFLPSWSNPCLAPDLFKISELYFDNTNKWFIELDKFYINDYDSIIFSSSTQKSLTKKIVFQNNIATLTTDSLISGVNINPLGDSITVTLYSKAIFFGNYVTDILVFGNYRNASIGRPKQGQSIAICSSKVMFDCSGKIINYPKFNFNKNPSIGTSNDCAGMYGNLYGIIYDENNQPASNITYKIENEFTTSTSGGYQTQVFARPNKVDSVWKIISTNPYYNGYYKLSMPIAFNMVPDSTINLDIYLGNVYVGMQDIKTNSLIKLYPSFINQSSILNYEISLPVKSSNCTLEIIDRNGKLIQSYNISDSKGIINLPQQLHQGIFLINFKVNNRIYKTSRIIIANK